MDARAASGIDASRDMEQARRDLLEARASLQSLMLDIRRGEGNLRLAENELDMTQIRAPIDGAVIAVDAREGSFLHTEGSPPVVLQMVDLTRLTIEAAIVEADINRMHPDMEIRFSTLANASRYWPATLRQINPTGRVNRGAVEFVALLDVDNPALELYPNMTVQVFFVTARADNVLAVPTRALTFADTENDGEQASVTVLLPDDSTVTRQVTIGTRDRINAEVLSGLAAGDRVIVGQS